MCLAVGLMSGENFEYEPSREKLLTRPNGIESIIESVSAPFSSKGEGVPDSAVAIRVTLDIPAHSQHTATLVLTSAPTETEAASRLIEVRREGMLTAAKAAQSPFGGIEAQLAEQILPDLFYPPRMSREWAIAARNNTHGQSALWAFGVSGDYPIILIEIHNAADASRAEPYIRLYSSLRIGGLLSELVIVYREGGTYDAPILQALRGAAQEVHCDALLGVAGGIHLVNLMIHGEQTLDFLTAVCAHNSARDLQRTGLVPMEYKVARVLPVERVKSSTETEENSFAIQGGTFSDAGFTVTDNPRLPWCHVLSNPTFGTLVSDKALGFTWAINARENKLSPWMNDTASDNRGELLLVRIGGQIYDVVCGSTACFGNGFARYNGQIGTMRTTVTVRVPEKGMWKTVELELENNGEEERDVQTVYYIEPVLGVTRKTARYTTAHWENGALLLRNPFGAVGGNAILTALGGADGCDCDRGSFLAGTWNGGTLSPLPDPCAAVIVKRHFPPRRKEKITFVLGFATHEAAALRIPELVRQSTQVRMDCPRLETPDKALNALCNDWLPRQVLTCRLFARTGFYQCGGAWGFRDQLQDTLAALWIDPVLAKRQLMRCTAVQFEEGDVLHWWHNLPRTTNGGGLRGVRTRCSDDLVWLPYVMAEYVTFTGDASILDCSVKWLSGDLLTSEEQERYFEPAHTAHKDSMYVHGVRALDKAMTHGDHGLPLIGSGDWNDGMNQVGEQGRGESVWLAMFLCMTLERFAPLCEQRGEGSRAVRYREAAEAYRQAADACYEKDRYLRAFYDDGTPLGRAGDTACSIDSLSQSFAVLCGLPAERVHTALDTALRCLIDREHGVVKLFTPAFASPASSAEGVRSAGYIAAYPSGVRENGGQYTHGAVWLAMALFAAGRADEGAEVLQLLNTVAKYTDKSGWRYGAEPYALAGDVYANSECPGRAGWSHYSGSAGWYYTTVLRHMLGLRPVGNRLEIHPHLPSGWSGFQITITLHQTPLVITARRGEGQLEVDGLPTDVVLLDGRHHAVVVPIPECIKQ